MAMREGLEIGERKEAATTKPGASVTIPKTTMKMDKFWKIWRYPASNKARGMEGTSRMEKVFVDLDEPVSHVESCDRPREAKHS